MRQFVLVIGSLTVAAGFNLFLIPHHVLSGGLSGVSMILGMITPVNTGLANFLLNLPLLIIGYILLGRKFIINTIFSVLVISIGLYLIPVFPVASDKILSSIFGGAISGIGVGLVFRSSGSTGGFDIISMIISRKRDFPIGTLLSAMNGIVIVICGFLFNWDSALNTLVAIFVAGKVVDALYTDHAKLSLMIITDKGEEMRTHLINNLYRGLTIMDGIGGYSNHKRHILVTVISKYELNDVKKLITEIDENAFVNITETIEVMGLFHRPSTQ